MPVDHREIAFETAIEQSLLASGGYVKANKEDFDRERCLDPTVLIPFLMETPAQRVGGSRKVARRADGKDRPRRPV